MNKKETLIYTGFWMIGLLGVTLFVYDISGNKQVVSSLPKHITWYDNNGKIIKEWIVESDTLVENKYERLFIKVDGKHFYIDGNIVIEEIKERVIDQNQEKAK